MWKGVKKEGTLGGQGGFLVCASCPTCALVLRSLCCCVMALTKYGSNYCRYFNYMGMLADEGSYDRMNTYFEAGLHPCDIILLMACEEGDTPKIEELFKSGADATVKDPQGRSCRELATAQGHDKVLELLERR